MKIFLFRLSRLISVVSILLCLAIGIVTYLLINDIDLAVEWTFIILLFTLTLMVPMVFNWLCFGRFSVWISKTDTEQTELD
jgi:ribose/xylose/arabinose/galactoside ABC-type transport system permease subunit